MSKPPKIQSKSVDPEIWVEKYLDCLFAYAFIRLRDVDLAEECIQETFLAALQSRKNFQGHSSEKTWLISILKRKIFDHYRKKHRDKKFIAACTLESLEAKTLNDKSGSAEISSSWFFDPSKVYEQKEFLAIFEQAVTELPDRSALIFILRELIGLHSKEICKLMNISIFNLYVIMFRARKQLRCFLRSKWLFEKKESDDRE